MIEPPKDSEHLAMDAAPDGTPSRPDRTDAEARIPVEQLLRTLENELIPRLLVAHRDSGDVPGGAPCSRHATLPAMDTDPWYTSGSVERFAEACLEQQHEVLHSTVCKLVDHGVALEAIYLRLLAPAARLLGERWSDDTLSFVEVSLGLCALHRLLGDCEALGKYQPDLSPRHSALLAATPGDQHTFGITMAADIFRRYGWRVTHMSGHGDAELLDELGRGDHPVFGLSLHDETQYVTLCELVREARRRMVGRELFVIVGGEAFRDHPERVVACGADCIAVDGHKAVFDARAALGREKACS